MRSLINHFNRYKFVLSELVKKGIVLRYRRSYLGIFWSLLEPLLTSVVLYFVFSAVLGRGGTPEHQLKVYGQLSFMVYILAGRLLYSFYNQTTKECTRVIRTNAALIKKVHIPKYLFPLSHLIFNYILFLISLIVLVVVGGVMMASGLQPFPTTRILLSFIPLINLILFAWGSSLILATLGTFFRDLEYLWNVFMTLMFYACAIFYPINKIQQSSYPWVAYFMKANPLYCIITNFRQCIAGSGDFIYRTTKAGKDIMEAVQFNYYYALYSLAASLILIGIGALVFRKNQDRFILYV